MADEDTQPLVGDVKTVFNAVGEEAIAASIENARLEQEMVCGYALVLKGTRTTHQRDQQGRDIYEVYATFAPAPLPEYVAPQGDAA